MYGFLTLRTTVKESISDLCGLISARTPSHSHLSGLFMYQVFNYPRGFLSVGYYFDQLIISFYRLHLNGESEAKRLCQESNHTC